MAERHRSPSASFFEVLGVEDVVFEKALHHIRDERDTLKEMQNLVEHWAKLEANYAKQMGDTAKKFGLLSNYPQLNLTLARVATEISNTHLKVADLLKQKTEDMGQAATDIRDRTKELERSLGDAAKEVATATKSVKDAEKMVATKQKDLDELMDKVAAGNATKVKKKYFFGKKSDDNDEKIRRLKMQKEYSESALSSMMKELELVVERSRGQRQTVFNNLEAEEKRWCQRIMQTFVDCLEKEMELQDQRRHRMQTFFDEFMPPNVDEDVQASINVFSRKEPAAGAAAPEGTDLNGIYMTNDDTSTYFKTKEVAGKRPSLQMKAPEEKDLNGIYMTNDDTSTNFKTEEVAVIRPSLQTEAPEEKDLNGIYMTNDDTSTIFKTEEVTGIRPSLHTEAPEEKDLNGIYMTIEEVAGKRPSLRSQIDEGFEEGASQMHACSALSKSEDTRENKASRPPLPPQRSRDSSKPA